MPQVSRQENDSNYKEAQLATQTLGQKLLDVRKREREQSSSLNLLRQQMIAKPDKFAPGSSVSVNNDGTIVGNDKFNEAFKLEKADLTTKEGPSSDARIIGNEAQEAEVISNRNYQMAREATKAQSDMSADVSRDIQSNLPATETAGILHDKVKNGKSENREKVAGTLDDINRNNPIMENSNYIPNTDPNVIPMPLNNPSSNSQNETSPSSTVSSSNSKGSKVTHSEADRMTIKEGAKGNMEVGSVKYKPTVQVLQDSGIDIRDENPYTMESQMDNAILMQAGAGDNYQVQNNPFLNAANKREQFLTNYAALQTGRYKADIKQGEVEVGKTQAQYEGNLQLGADSKTYDNTSINVSSSLRAGNDREKFEKHGITDGSGHELNAVSDLGHGNYEYTGNTLVFGPKDKIDADTLARTLGGGETIEIYNKNTGQFDKIKFGELADRIRTADAVGIQIINATGQKQYIRDTPKGITLAADEQNLKMNRSTANYANGFANKAATPKTNKAIGE